MLLRPTARPRATALTGYKVLAGVVAGGIAEMLAVTWARDRNPDHPDYVVPTLVATAVGVVVALLTC